MKLLLIACLFLLSACATYSQCPPERAYYQILLPWGPTWAYMDEDFFNPDMKEGRWLTEEEYKEGIEEDEEDIAI